MPENEPRYRVFRCPRCRTDISVTKDMVGTQVECPDCDSLVTVPDYLDFETETDYERSRRLAQDAERDKLLSPARNPNREGVDFSGDLYDVQDDSAPQKELKFVPVRCRVCGTLMQAPEELLGQKIVCPDCGTVSVVTTALRDQQKSIDVKFQPKEQDPYALGETPEAPRERFVLRDGRVVEIDPKKKSIAPEFKAPDHHFDPSVKPKLKTDKELEVPLERTALEEAFDMDPKSRANAQARREYEEKLRRKRNAKGIARVFRFITNMAERRQLALTANPTTYLPPLVLRSRNGELVWTHASPPKRAPLFNGTFRAAKGEELIARAFVMAGLIAAVAFVVTFFLLPSWGDRLNPTNIAAKLDQAIGWITILPCFFLSSAFAGLFFWSTYTAGNQGAYLVAEWREEDLMGFLGYGAWFAIMIICANMPGAMVAGIVMNFVHIDWAESGEALFGTLLLNGVFTACFWLYFPILWLSTQISEYPFAPITSRVARSFVTKGEIWLQFYLFSALVFAIPTFIWLCFYGRDAFWYATAGLFPFFAIFYGLLLGRLSWILDAEERDKDFDDSQLPPSAIR